MCPFLSIFKLEMFRFSDILCSNSRLRLTANHFYLSVCSKRTKHLLNNLFLQSVFALFTLVYCDSVLVQHNGEQNFVSFYLTDVKTARQHLETLLVHQNCIFLHICKQTALKNTRNLVKNHTAHLKNIRWTRVHQADLQTVRFKLSGKTKSNKAIQLEAFCSEQGGTWGDDFKLTDLLKGIANLVTWNSNLWGGKMFIY